ncbi:cilia- and flagella-associated protein 90 [Centropristis striata]|uniref:cilia- and flagella-associated protein 90 n=1 Tax=Centropristis striata TaxID=184440 RepID=UPI0027E03753|nr:cilia- and flagella-associated protein 90 [Centropristis striata]
MMDVSLEARTKPLSTLSAFSYIPPRRKEAKEMTYYNTESKVPEVSMYDQVFHQEQGYDMKLRRDDRKHYKGRGLNINDEEKSRSVPVRSSAEYGRRPVPALYQTGREHARVACIKAEFFMENGIIWNLAEGYGSVAPI